MITCRSAVAVSNATGSVDADHRRGRAQVEEVEEDLRVGPREGLAHLAGRDLQLAAGGGYDDDALRLRGSGDSPRGRGGGVLVAGDGALDRGD